MATTISNLPREQNPAPNDNIPIDDVSEGKGKRVEVQDFVASARPAKTSSEIESQTMDSGSVWYDSTLGRLVIGPAKRALVGLRDTGKKLNTIDDLENETPVFYETLLGATPKRDVLGYHSVGDGGGSMYIWVPDMNRSKHNGGTIISPTWNNGSFGDVQDPNWVNSSPNDSNNGCWVIDTTHLFCEQLGVIVRNKNYAASNTRMINSFNDYLKNNNLSGKLVFIRGGYWVDGTIIADSNIAIDMGTNSEIVAEKDKDVLEITRNTRIDNLKISTQSVNDYTSTALKMRAVKHTMMRETVEYGHININGNYSGGTAFKLINKNPNVTLTFLTFDHITISGYDKGLVIKNVDDGTNNVWSNSNTFKYIKLNHVRKAITLSTSKISGISSNVFDTIHIQTPHDCKYVLHAKNAKHNIFNNFIIWDWVNSPEKLAVIFSDGTRGNTINNLFLYDEENVLDKTGRNRYKIVVYNNGTEQPITPSGLDIGTYSGDMDNFDPLAFANQRHNVNVTKGASNIVGDISNIFTPKGDRFIKADLSNSDLQIVVTFKNKVYFAKSFGVLFRDRDSIGKNVKIEVYQSSGNWKEIINVTDNKSLSVNRTSWENYNRIEKIRLTISGQIKNKIRIFRFWAASPIEEGVYLGRGGGELYGDTYVNKNNITQSISHYIGKDKNKKSDSISKYPDGISIQEISTGEWPYQFGTLITIKLEDKGRSYQIFKANRTAQETILYRGWNNFQNQWYTFKQMGIPFGTTSRRPSNPHRVLPYFDVTLGKPIWYDGSNWVDATGTTV